MGGVINGSIIFKYQPSNPHGGWTLDTWKVTVQTNLFLFYNFQCLIKYWPLIVPFLQIIQIILVSEIIQVSMWEHQDFF